jgi:isopenicillin-N epimerase
MLILCRLGGGRIDRDRTEIRAAVGARLRGGGGAGPREVRARGCTPRTGTAASKADDTGTSASASCGSGERGVRQCRRWALGGIESKVNRGACALRCPFRRGPRVALEVPRPGVAAWPHPPPFPRRARRFHGVAASGGCSRAGRRNRAAARPVDLGQRARAVRARPGLGCISRASSSPAIRRPCAMRSMRGGARWTAIPSASSNRACSKRKRTTCRSRCSSRRGIHRRQARRHRADAPTTEGLALIYHGLPLKAGDEVLAPRTIITAPRVDPLRHRTQRAPRRAGSSCTTKRATRRSTVSCNLLAGIGPKTRVVGVTWVHSSTGMRLPIRELTQALKAKHPDVLVVLDGVHGIGAVDEPLLTIARRRITSPRARTSGCSRRAARACVVDRGRLGAPAPDGAQLHRLGVYNAWADERPIKGPNTRRAWRPAASMRSNTSGRCRRRSSMHQAMGRARVAAASANSTSALKAQLADNKKINVHTPRSAALSAGLVAFEIDGLKPEDIVRRLGEKKIVASTSPYKVTYARLAPSLVNTPDEVDRAARAVLRTRGLIRRPSGRCAGRRAASSRRVRRAMPAAASGLMRVGGDNSQSSASVVVEKRRKRNSRASARRSTAVVDARAVRIQVRDAATAQRAFARQALREPRAGVERIVGAARADHVDEDAIRPPGSICASFIERGVAFFHPHQAPQRANDQAQVRIDLDFVRHV